MLKPRFVSGALVFGSYALCVACGDGAYVGAPNATGGFANAGGTNATGGNGAGNSGGSAQSGSSNGGTSGAGGGASGSGGVTGGVLGAGIGETCQMDMDCRPGLACTSGMCQVGHSLTTGSRCVIADECETGLQCVSGKCGPGGSGMTGDSCTGDGDCAAGMRCALTGLSSTCVPEGMTDAGGSCTTNLDCLAGLACVSGTCAVSPGGTLLGTPFTGVTCDPPSTGTVRAYFEVPGAMNAQEGDFFRLPFPNDARRSASGMLDLSGFPTPGAGFLGYDPVKLYVDAVASTDSAWGAFPTVIFRFSGGFTVPDNDAVHFTDLTPGSVGAGGWGAWFAGGHGAYVCDNSASIQPYIGAPLTPGHTYAVWMLTTITDANKGAIERAENFVSMLSDTAPTDAKLTGPYAAYKPFRDYIKTAPKIESVPADPGDPTSTPPRPAAPAKTITLTTADVLVGSVFTVGAIRDPMKSLAAAIAKAPAPTTKSWVKCATGVTSPCSDGSDCTGGAADFDEYQALVQLPNYQAGTLPYLTAADGGDIEIPSTSAPDVCMSLTVPKGTMPTAGWPVVVYAHGTGGTFRSHVVDNTAGVLSTGTPAGSVKFAVLGIDQVENNARRGGSTQSADNLFFNFANPKAARGNPLQGAADQLSLVRLVSSFTQTVGTDTIKLDPAGITFWGHSQGATEGSLAMPYADGVKAVVLSGNGAGLEFSLLNKTSPVNIAAGLPLALQDQSLVPSMYTAPEFNPVLALLQEWIDPADPLHFAHVITAVPEMGHTAKHVFQPFGIGDTYAPPKTLANYALAGGLTEVADDASVGTNFYTIYDRSVTKPHVSPMSGNITVAGKPYTLGVRQYAPPANDDGHFVAFDVASANADVVRFLSQGIGATPPQIGN
ncbi:MAG TPA: hypothetical protein VGI10_09885 [Polyangiaceae bacterium]